MIRNRGRDQSGDSASDAQPRQRVWIDHRATGYTNAIVEANFSSKFGTEINIGLGIIAVLVATFIFQVKDLFKNLTKEARGT